jgi:hypothetical protein
MQPSLFDQPTADAARDEAIARVDAHASPNWKAEALEAVRSLCERQPEFIADDVWETGLPRPAEGRALGAVMMRATRLGFCVGTNEFRKSAQVQCHSNYRRVWRSLLFRDRVARAS